MPRNEGTVMIETYPKELEITVAVVRNIFALYDAIFVHGFVRYGLFLLVSLPVRFLAKADLVYCTPVYEEK